MTESEKKLEEAVLKIREQIFAGYDSSADISDQELMERISRQVRRYAKEHMLSLLEQTGMEKRVFDSFRKMDILQELLDRNDVTEVLVNGAKKIFYESGGQLYRYEKSFASEEILENLIQNIAGRQNRSINESQPIVDTRLADGSRVNIVLHPVSLDGSCISIRKFSKDPMTLQQLIRYGAISKEIAEWLILFVKSGYNLFISGGTGSGKTTFLNALSAYIPQGQRVITIEDSAELQLKTVDNLVRLETRNATQHGTDPITIRDLIRTSLRMRPDRLLVGEVRGAEALDMLQAINTGHNGSMSTGHANSTTDMLSRLETMVLMGMDLPIGAIRGQIAHGLDLMIHLERMRDHSRKLTEVTEVTGLSEGRICLNPLFRFREEEEQNGKIIGRWDRVGTLASTKKLEAAGYLGEYRRLVPDSGD